MSLSNKILSEITEINKEIEANHPELLSFLDENPITLPNELHPQVDDSALQLYLDTLKDILERYKLENDIKKKDV